MSFLGAVMDIPISKSDIARMGRPPLYGKTVLIHLDKSVPGRIEKVLRGKEKRADFIRAAVERELKRREKKRQ